MPGRIEEHPERGPGLVVVLARADGQHLLLPGGWWSGASWKASTPPGTAFSWTQSSSARSMGAPIRAE